MPNTLAQIVLFSWPLVAWALFARLRADTALIATVLLGYLFIPERTGFDLPALPAVDKKLMPVLCAALGMWLIARRQEQALRKTTPRAAFLSAEAPGRRQSVSRVSKIIPLILTGLVLNIFVTWATNQQPLFYGTHMLYGIRPYDIGMMLSFLLIKLLPLLIALRYLRDREAQISLLKVMALCGLAYSVLVLWEIRMSPRLNAQLYGFFAHDWRQHLRSGGFRPIVFLEHGLRVGIFLAMASLSAAVLARGNVGGKRLQWLALSLWLFVCLALSHNLGATLIAAALLPVVLFLPTRAQLLIGLVVGIMVMLYPMARGSGLTPAEQIVSAVEKFSPDRAFSLEYRLKMEDILLHKANEKPLSGWGGWARYLIFNENTGERVSIPDGVWIITMGESGWIGYLGTFGLLCLPVIFAALRARRFQLDVIDAGIVIVLCANLIDLIPNSPMVPPLWLIAGTLWARLQQESGFQTDVRASAVRGTPPQRRAAPSGEARATRA